MSPELRWDLIPFNQLTLTQLYGLLRLRQDVFIVEQQCAYPDIDGLDQPAEHLLGWSTSGVWRPAHGCSLRPSVFRRPRSAA